MKKFISMVMAAAMVVTMVPATAFAANDATFKVVKAMEVTKDAATGYKTAIVDADDPQTAEDWYLDTQLQIKIKDVDTRIGTEDSFDITLSLTNAKFVASLDAGELPEDVNFAVTRPADEDRIVGYVNLKEAVAEDDKKVVLTVKEADYDFAEGDVINFSLPKGVLALTKDKVGTQATVKVTGDFGSSEALTFLTVVGKELVAEVEDIVTVAEEEVVELHEDGLTIKAKVGNLPTGDDKDEDLTIKLSKGFEFVNGTLHESGVYKVTVEDEDELKVNLNSSVEDEVVIEGIKIEATTAKAGDVATLKVYADDFTTAAVEVAKVCDYAVVMELVDADEDVPVIWSGVDSQNTGLTVDDSHKSLEVKIYETFEGAWNMNKTWTLSLPEGVYVVDDEGVEAEDVNGTLGVDGDTDLNATFEKAYVRGEHKEFEFKKYTFENTRTEDDSKVHEMEFTLNLVADPGFVGDVVLKLEGSGLETQEVVIATFVSPIAVKAEQNDVIIDYRYTEIPTAITVTEAEAGLWEEGLEIGFTVDRADYIDFEDDEATFTVNEASDMEVDDFVDGGSLWFVVTEESEEEPAEIVISDIELFMDRTIPAGPYSLDMYFGMWDKETVENDDGEDVEVDVFNPSPYDMEYLLGQPGCSHKDCVVCADVNDYSTTVHEAWVNVVTAGRDVDDASFTTTVVVPVGESYIVAGDKQHALDVPAYINADGYTMIPVRAVATALGINNDAVQWNQATKTVIIMYGQRIITMTAGQNVVYVSGTAIPAASSVEIVDGRAFLGLRDLATTLGVAQINWDPATKVATLNPKA